MVACAVAFHSQQEAALVIRIVYGQVDLEPGRSDLRLDAVPVSLQRHGDRLFERAVHRCTGHDRHVHLSRLGELQEPLQHSRPRVPCHVEADVGVPDRCEDPALLPCPGEEHVEPALAAFARDGAETLGHVAAGVLAVTDRNEHHVAFVTLDILKILHEERLILALPAEGVEFGILSAHEFQGVADRVPLSHGKGHDAKGLVRPPARVGEHLLRQGLRLPRIVALLASLVFAIHVDKGHSYIASSRVRTGRTDQAIVIELMVRDPNQRGMLGAVMPAQHAPRHSPRLT